MKDRIGTALWVAGAIICAWALSVSLSMMFDFTIEEARQNFRQGSFIFGAAVVFAFVFRSKVQTWGAFEKFLIYALVPVAGILLTAYGWCPAVRARTRRKPRSLIRSPARSRLPKRPFRPSSRSGLLPRPKNRVLI